ncbi:MAG: glutamine-hydrolyzing carbamoyl-phosphate synthase small subunit [Parvibaculales bacterium]
MTNGWKTEKTTGVLVLADGTVLEGTGIGAAGHAVGEVCFNTAMTGYQEIITDPSYAGQIITFTFPHIGNVGTNASDSETSNVDNLQQQGASTQGIIIRESITNPANYRAVAHLDAWLKDRGLIGLANVDTRSLTRHIRENGMFDATIAHQPDGAFDIEALQQKAAMFPGLEGLDLAARVTTAKTYDWAQGRWGWEAGFDNTPTLNRKVVALDFGVKNNILRCLATAGCQVVTVPGNTSAEDVLALNPDGVFLSNGPGDPAATGDYAVPEIAKLVDSGKPVFGICLGHQMLALALGAKTEKMKQGHHGANHPVKDMTTGKVEITSMNHGFTVDRDSLPAEVEETHISLFDGTNCGIQLKGRPVFSVQYHPEASPGPQDSHYLFDRFTAAMDAAGHQQESQNA